MFYYGLIIILVLWIAYSKGWIFASFKSIDAKSAVALIEEHKDIVILDVRTKAEYKSSHLKNAILIPSGALSGNLEQLNKYKDKQIIVYCHSGGRSMPAARLLKRNGFTPLNVKGGIMLLEHYGAKIVS